MPAFAGMTGGRKGDVSSALGVTSKDGGTRYAFPPLLRVLAGVVRTSGMPAFAGGGAEGSSGAKHRWKGPGGMTEEGRRVVGREGWH